MRLLDDADELAFGDGELDLSSYEDRCKLVELVNRQPLWDDDTDEEEEWDL